MGKLTADKNYKAFFTQVKKRISDAQYEALRQVNLQLIGLYWDLGKMIVSRQKKHNWGKSIVQNLAKDLQNAFPGMSGFSSQNIWYMRQFYLTYKGKKKLQPLVGEISWTKHLLFRFPLCEIWRFEKSEKMKSDYRHLVFLFETLMFSTLCIKNHFPVDFSLQPHYYKPQDFYNLRNCHISQT